MKLLIYSGLFFLILIGCSGDRSNNNIYSILISRNGDLVKEEYFNGREKSDLQNVQSVTKSVLSLLVGIAIDKGFIENEDVPIFNYFPESNYFSEGEKRKITIQHLLSHTSGLKWNGYLEHSRFLESEHPTEYMLNKDMEAIPGAEFNYNSGGFHLLSAILTKATGLSTLEFARESLFKFIEIDTLIWNQLNDDYYDGAGFGLNLLSTDMISIGQLLLNNGLLDTVRVISEEWLDKSFNIGLKKETDWGLRKSKYGYGWYAATYNGLDINYAMGYGGQFIFLVPSTQLVIVVTHNHDTANGIAQQVDFIKNILPELIEEYR